MRPFRHPPYSPPCYYEHLRAQIKLPSPLPHTHGSSMDIKPQPLRTPKDVSLMYGVVMRGLTAAVATTTQEILGLKNTPSVAQLDEWWESQKSYYRQLKTWFVCSPSSFASSPRFQVPLVRYQIRYRYRLQRYKQRLAQLNFIAPEPLRSSTDSQHHQPKGSETPEKHTGVIGVMGYGRSRGEEAAPAASGMAQQPYVGSPEQRTPAHQSPGYHEPLKNDDHYELFQDRRRTTPGRLDDTHDLADSFLASSPLLGRRVQREPTDSDSGIGLLSDLASSAPLSHSRDGDRDDSSDAPLPLTPSRVGPLDAASPYRASPGNLWSAQGIDSDVLAVGSPQRASRFPARPVQLQGTGSTQTSPSFGGSASILSPPKKKDRGRQGADEEEATAELTPMRYPPPRTPPRSAGRSADSSHDPIAVSLLTGLSQGQGKKEWLTRPQHRTRLKIFLYIFAPDDERQILFHSLVIHLPPFSPHNK